MFTLRKSDDRRHQVEAAQDSWFTFFLQDLSSPLSLGFRTLENVEDSRVRPLAEIGHQTNDLESLILMVRGSMEYCFEDDTNVLLHAGDFQRITAKCRYSSRNPSATDEAQLIHFSVRPSMRDDGPSHEHLSVRELCPADELCMIASGNGANGSLSTRQDLALYWAVLHAPHRLVHQLDERHSAWVHVVRGELTIGSETLHAGDSVGINGENTLPFSSSDEAEFVLLDLGSSS